MTQPMVTRMAASLWAKSPTQVGEFKLGVLEHLLNVAACAAEILELEPPQAQAQLAADLGLPPQPGLAWVAALVALHDLGKASPAFQVKWPPGHAEVDAAVTFSELLREPYAPHGVVTEATLLGFLQALGWRDPLARQVSEAVGCHHGFRTVNEQDRDPPTAQVGDAAWDAVRHELCRLVTVGVGADHAAVPPVTALAPAAFMRLSGLTSVADWLGSSFPLPSQLDLSAHQDPAGYYRDARVRARELLREQVHWPQAKSLHPQLPPLEEVFGYLAKERGPEVVFRPRPLQTALTNALAGVGGPALVLVEAPMGEGKTEAALYASLQLQRAAGHRGLYVALPTQATGSAMFGRLVRFLREQGSEKPVSIQLAHGGTLLNDPFQQRLEHTRVFYRTNTDAPHEDSVETVRVEEWFTSRKRALLDEYGVGTVDQALLGVLGVSHQFVRLWGLGNRVVVLDEVHAYDTYTSELIAALLSWLRALGSSVVVLSATLPQRSRCRLLEAWGVGPTPEAPAYPRWTVATSAGAVADTIPPAGPAQGGRPVQRLSVRALASDTAAVAHRAVEVTVGGGCTVVIVNTVQRAQDVQREVVRLLEARGIVAQTCTASAPKSAERLGVLLYHARYPADERNYREDAVLRYLGKDGNRPERLILIATQVAEQSLDFDADVMISDLAPVDLLLQRAGRLHRHERPPESRRGHTEPVLCVSGLDEWPAAAMKAEAWGRVYAPALLYRTWRTLEERSGVTLPDDLDPLVQTVYGPLYPLGGLNAEQAGAVQTAEARMQRAIEEQENQGKYAHIGLPGGFWEARVGRHSEKPHPKEPDTESVNDDVLGTEEGDFPRTRLGEESVRLVPVERVGGSWRVCPPPKSMWPKDRPWLELLPGFTTLEKSDRDIAAPLYRRSLSVSRWEIVEAARTGQLWAHSLGNRHRGWRAHPLLRDVWPLDLTAGHRDFGRLRVRLDPELGLVYESRS